MKKKKKHLGTLVVLTLLALTASGCGNRKAEAENKNLTSDNVIITETGEVLEKEPAVEAEEPEVTPEPTSMPELSQTEEFGELPSPDVIPEVEIAEPVQEQVITEEDQTSPQGNKLQIVFLGDSIFDNNRDGTGVPYLTGVQCNADVYNLAIGGTCASIEIDEKYGNDEWTSSSLVGIVKAMKGDISTDVFAGTRAKELLDSSEINFKETDYFVIEYGINDFLRATPLSSETNEYDFRTYVGALRYAVSNLKEYADDATIILCGPHYTQFYSPDNRFIGDGNTLNTGYGTLFDYMGKCQYVANESNSEFFNAYMDLGIDGYTADEYLEDGVHLTEEGRHLYADALAEKILKIEETKND